MSNRYPNLSKSRFGQIRKLLHRKGRESSGVFLAEGTQAVREALATPGSVQLLIVDNPDNHEELVKLADPETIWTATQTQVRELTDTVTPQGIFAVCRIRQGELAGLVDPKLVVICAQIRDPGNAGTVIRSADAFGADAVIFTTGSVDPYNPKTVRSTVGSIFHVPIFTQIELADAVDFAHRKNMSVLAADGDGVNLGSVSEQLANPVAWMFGNEAWGLPETAAELADELVGIEMWGRAESLNLSTAAAICLYSTAVNQRK